MEFKLTIHDKETAPEPEPDVISVNLSRLAHATGYSISHLSRVFSRETTPSVPCLETVAAELDMAMEDLYKRIKDGTVTVGGKIETITT
jgi:AraC-like DNA-binding protein